MILVWISPRIHELGWLANIRIRLLLLSNVSHPSGHSLSLFSNTFSCKSGSNSPLHLNGDPQLLFLESFLRLSSSLQSVCNLRPPLLAGRATSVPALNLHGCHLQPLMHFVHLLTDANAAYQSTTYDSSPPGLQPRSSSFPVIFVVFQPVQAVLQLMQLTPQLLWQKWSRCYLGSKLVVHGCDDAILHDDFSDSSSESSPHDAPLLLLGDQALRQRCFCFSFGLLGFHKLL
mmetsp:Transcript_89998/g.160211  ORF Transcript_89998/g.160211 Transcript_89998/m.160211 type:complete len:231 (-) Transcript_89998:268-960(-)